MVHPLCLEEDTPEGSASETSVIPTFKLKSVFPPPATTAVGPKAEPQSYSAIIFRVTLLKFRINDHITTTTNPMDPCKAADHTSLCLQDKEWGCRIST